MRFAGRRKKTVEVQIYGRNASLVGLLIPLSGFRISSRFARTEFFLFFFPILHSHRDVPWWPIEGTPFARGQKQTIIIHKPSLFRLPLP